MKLKIKETIFRFIVVCTFLLGVSNTIIAQQFPTPDKVFGDLFVEVQMQRVFPDNKTFADAIPLFSPQEILEKYHTEKKKADFSLSKFVSQNFKLTSSTHASIHSDSSDNVVVHIEKLWDLLTRKPDTVVQGSSLIPLPHPYIVPGGRFQEVYYWDSYFTMLGLVESKKYDLIENIIDNFSYLIDTIGHIPNGNRTYFVSRSQPPFYSLMVDLLADRKGENIYTKYLPQLEKEYKYWMDQTSGTKHVVQLTDSDILNRYWDMSNRPREESFYEDSTLELNNHRQDLYRNMRSGAESGWDFSTRWFKDGQHLATIENMNIIPVDLNCLLYHLELTIAKGYTIKKEFANAAKFKNKAIVRKNNILKYCYNVKDGWFYDYNIRDHKMTMEKTIVGWFPYFFNMVPKKDFAKSKVILINEFIKPGGVVTTLKHSGQQWDAPNGWAPLQWITIQGLENYGDKALAKDIASKWARVNIRTYKNTGKLMEKYNVEDLDLKAGGGEYPSQDGFGWTNGVLLKIIKKYDIDFK